METVIELPGFPEVGVFVDPRVKQEEKRLDQAVLMCRECSHIQLDEFTPPEQIYGESYAHRSTVSHIAGAATDKFVEYIAELSGQRYFEQVLEVGCNDLVLLNKLSAHSRHLLGIDPIWKGKTPLAPPRGITIVGDYAENVNLETYLCAAPDLIVSSHNLEHIEDPAGLLRRLMAVAAEDCLFVIEVPDADSMINQLRFDQIFHQHLHYFTLHGFLRLLEAAGGHYLDHRYNHRNWGGSFTLAFKKTPTGVPAPSAGAPRPDRVRRQYSLFRERIRTFLAVLSGLDCEVYGYGAGQMVPSVAYHMGSQLEFLNAILDDDPRRIGLRYPGLAVPIVAAMDAPPLNDAAVMITALDAVIPIMERLRGLNPRHILVPCDIY